MVQKLFSNWLHDHLCAGDQLTALLPAGDFHINCTQKDKLLFLAAGSGITPMLSMLRWLTDTLQQTDVILIYSARNQRDIIAYQALLLLTQQNPRFTLFLTLTQPSESIGWTGYRGRLSQSML